MMIKHLFSPLLVVTLSISCCCSALNAFAMTLADCVHEAIQNNPGLSSEHHLINADDADIAKKRATTLPYLSSQLQAYEVNGTPVTEWVPSGVFQPENGLGRRGAHWAPVAIESIGVVYPIVYEGSFFGLNDPPVVSAARKQLTQEELVKILREQKVVVDVVSDFIRTLSYRQQAATYSQMAEASRKQLSILREQVALGRKLPQEIQILQGELQALEYARSAVQGNAGNFASDLASVVSGSLVQPHEGIQIDNVLPQLAPLPALHEFLDKVMPDHPALLIENTKSEIAREQLRVDEANRWPTASFAASFGGAQDLDYFSGSATHLRPTAFQSYLTLTIPLFDFGGRRAAVRESNEGLLAQKSNRAQVELDIRSSITSEYGAILDDTALMFKLRSQLARDQANLERIREEMAEGKVDQLTVLGAEVPTLQDTLNIQVAEMSERLKYAELQNLSAGRWHWAP
jgi:outer membrane protein TolC